MLDYPVIEPVRAVRRTRERYVLREIGAVKVGLPLTGSKEMIESSKGRIEGEAGWSRSCT